MSNLLKLNEEFNSIVEIIEEAGGDLITATEIYNERNMTSITEEDFNNLLNALEQDVHNKIKNYILKAKELNSQIVLYKDLKDNYVTKTKGNERTIDFLKENVLTYFKLNKLDKVKTEVGTVYIKNTESVELKEGVKELLENALQDDKEVCSEAITLNYNLTIDETFRIIQILSDKYVELFDNTLLSKLYSKFEIQLDKKLAKEELNTDNVEDHLENHIYPKNLYSINKNQSIVGL